MGIILTNVQVIRQVCSAERVLSAIKLLSIPWLCDVLVAYFAIPSSLVSFPSTPIPISSYFDNQAASIKGTTGNFNQKGSTYAAEYLPTGPWLFDGVTVDTLIVFGL